MYTYAKTFLFHYTRIYFKLIFNKSVAYIPAVA